MLCCGYLMKKGIISKKEFLDELELVAGEMEETSRRIILTQN